MSSSAPPAIAFLLIYIRTSSSSSQRSCLLASMGIAPWLRRFLTKASLRPTRTALSLTPSPALPSMRVATPRSPLLVSSSFIVPSVTRQRRRATRLVSRATWSNMRTSKTCNSSTVIRFRKPSTLRSMSSRLTVRVEGECFEDEYLAHFPYHSDGLNNQTLSQAGAEADLDVQFAFGLTYPTPGTYVHLMTFDNLENPLFPPRQRFWTTGGSPPFNPDEITTTNTNEPYTEVRRYFSQRPFSDIDTISYINSGWTTYCRTLALLRQFPRVMPMSKCLESPPCHSG